MDNNDQRTINIKLKRFKYAQPISSFVWFVVTAGIRSFIFILVRMARGF
jgi:hypothetical protein